MKYWIIVNGAQLGPMDLDELLALNPQPDSPVWHEGLEDWVAAAAVPEIASSFIGNAMPEVPRDNAEMAEGNAVEEAYRRGYKRGYEEGSASRDASRAGQQYYNTGFAPGVDPNRYYSRQDPYADFGPGPICPPTYLVGAILCTIFCCTIPGIIAIIYSVLVSKRFGAGNYAGAESASSNAMWWVIISLVLGLISAPLSIIGLLG